MAQEHSGHRQRMRERFMTQGLEGFAPHEILELILYYAIPRVNVNPLAHQLLERFGSLHGVLEADVQELMKVEGVGPQAATLLSLFVPVERKLRQSRSAEKKKLTNRAVCKAHCQGLLAGLRQEHMYMVCLNAQMEILQNVLIAKGTINEVPSYPRVVAEAALRANAHAVVICHNHPGGSMIPSQQDMEATQRLSEMLQSLDVVLFDHVIVAGDDVLSMLEHHLLEHECVNSAILTRVADPKGELLIRNRVRDDQKGKR